MLTPADKAWIKLKSIYLRITLSKFTTAFFLFSFAQCFSQGIIQSFLYSIDSDASSLTTSVLEQSNVTWKNELAWLTRPNSTYRLELCHHIPYGASSDPCIPVYETGSNATYNFTGYRKRDRVTASDLARLPDISHPGRTKDGTTVKAVFDNKTGDITGVELDKNNDKVTLNLQCARVLIYPDQVLKNSRREELALIGSQFWLFLIGFHAVVYESAPHLLAVFFTRVIQSGWSAYSIWRTKDIHRRFNHLIINPETPCHTKKLFPTYFSQRLAWQIPDLVLNLVSLLVTAYLGWKLVRLYNQHAFKRVGPPKHIVRIYRFFLAIWVCLQLSVFFLVTLMGLWVDQLVNSAVKHVSSHTTIYFAAFLFTLICLIPWITLGWYSVSREMKRMMVVFLVINLAFLGCWAAMFDSLVFRWTFVQWPFLGCMSVAALIFLTASFVLGVVCWRKFGEGLAQYLHVENMLEDMDFEPEVFQTDVEKAKISPSDKWEPTMSPIDVTLPSVAYFPTTPK
ncbi:hypothetical protein PUNSTDRAFT_137327 [Punctularia strigosozonata HHB-11173 SS5]|uniref:uncharacterized protein n=1 Tax=Punctularia strigosozonata (strain HHB-11173) TaxID=741275 RepID=UPI0004418447|nr:uncharacterized protein PUNSTDRAFT_137327 [Punctularia strigosozonata HHB-11173 SS5]EIN05842.1 hypothetical protein PUNSTDRAFT_137327 [Punctularia strigosozonata HHB-11173 SS5]